MSNLNIKKILIIDDSEDFRKLMIKFFEKVCAEATIDVYDPADGKPSETFVWKKYNLIILDYDLGNGENQAYFSLVKIFRSGHELFLIECLVTR